MLMAQQREEGHPPNAALTEAAALACGGHTPATKSPKCDLQAHPGPGAVVAVWK